MEFLLVSLALLRVGRMRNSPNQRPLRMALSVMPPAEQPARQPAAHRKS